MNDPNQPLYQDNAYLFGQILATRALLLAFAELAATRPELRQVGTAALQRLRDSMLDQAIPEQALHAVEEVERVLRSRLD